MRRTRAQVRRPDIQRPQIKRRSSKDQGPRFVIGLDLGQVQDYTAVAIIERVAPEPSDTSAEPSRPTFEFRLRHLQRYALGTSYPAIVDDITDLMTEPILVGQSRLVVDGTGVGVPVVEMFRTNGRAVWADVEPLTRGS